MYPYMKTPGQFFSKKAYTQPTYEFQPELRDQKQPFIVKRLMCEILSGVFFAIQVTISVFLIMRLVEIIKSTVDGKQIDMGIIITFLVITIIKGQAGVMLFLAALMPDWDLTKNVSWLYTVNLFVVSFQCITLIAWFIFWIFTVDLNESHGMETLVGLALLSLTLIEFVIYFIGNSIIGDLTHGVSVPYLKMVPMYSMPQGNNSLASNVQLRKMDITANQEN